jgi:hypothetical protein
VVVIMIVPLFLLRFVIVFLIQRHWFYSFNTFVPWLSLLLIPMKLYSLTPRCDCLCHIFARAVLVVDPAKGRFILLLLLLLLYTAFILVLLHQRSQKDTGIAHLHAVVFCYYYWVVLLY